MFTSVLPESRAGIMERYDHFHHIMSHFQRFISDALGRSEIKRAGKALGIWHNGCVVLGDENEVPTLLDFAIYGLHDANGKTAVQVHACAHPPRTDSDEELVLHAMTRARYCLLQVTKRVPGVGVECYDILRKQLLLMANHGFGMTAEVGMVIACRLVSVPGFEISTGADLPVDPETFLLISEFLNQAAREFEITCNNIDQAARMEAVSVGIIRACLDSGCADQIARLNITDDVPPDESLSRALPMEGVSRNRPCPCGSGKKYKRCCGELARH